MVEEYLAGPEVSLFAVSDGETVVPLLPAQDFKRAFDGDVGPNTGGMGSYAPLPWAPPDLVDEVTERVLRPTVAEMARRGTPYGGLLYAGLALTADGPQVVEFNARFGDPETQAVLRPARVGPAGAAARRGHRDAGRPPAAALAVRVGGHRGRRRARATRRGPVPATRSAGSRPPRPSRASPSSTPGRAGSAASS